MERASRDAIVSALISIFGVVIVDFSDGSSTVYHHLDSAVQDKDLATEIRENLYVDNLILSAETSEEVYHKSRESRQIFSDMGMNLREFLSNDPTLRNHLSSEACAKSSSQKVLGILWDAETDSLHIRCDLPPTETVTKRVVARLIASVYDPFGWLVPLLTQAKRFQQNLWRNRFDWDTALPNDLAQEWNIVTQNVHGFQQRFQRRFSNNFSATSLAVFADASDIAMAACAYLFDKSYSTLVMAKCKLPSLKSTITTPKMEINALTMASRLALSIFKALKDRIPILKWKIFLFSDSQIALHWISMSTHKVSAGVLVNYRIKEIRRITEAFMEAGAEHEQAIEDNAVLVNMLAEYPDNDSVGPLLDWKRFASFTAAKRVTSWVLLFLSKLMKALPQERILKVLANLPELQLIGIPSRIDRLDATTMRAAQISLIRNHQRLFLTSAYRKSMENTLRLFQDDRTIWRSKGRLDNSSLSEECKNPIFIAPKTELATLLTQEAHGKYHRGIEHTIATVREQYWIPRLRQLVRHIVHHCILCRRFNGLPYRYPDSVNLPPRRVQRSRPFQHIGLDFFDLPPILEQDIPSKTANILADGSRSQALDNTIHNVMVNHEIQWKHITAYAPWQGGFYERLIKSIKHSLYKAMRNEHHHTLDHLTTVITEVEACLNSRPLTYQSSDHDDLTQIRPIDFLQRDMTISFPYASTTTSIDADYLPPEEVRTLQTRIQAEEALKKEEIGDPHPRHTVKQLIPDTARCEQPPKRPYSTFTILCIPFMSYATLELFP
ncbi:Pao retrotransposon peptidase [Ancylostoma ceylanicum]|uniref:Pao retrotransposon peptidase n=1 Tax=Ancylostoma ceylanicum TaxID=53326 RepID=A0A0D6LNZ7_9BILA|nr:Pao retrotransposon peptidase [Ancylostoma ceylanicum]